MKNVTETDFLTELLARKIVDYLKLPPGEWVAYTGLAQALIRALADYARMNPEGRNLM